MYESVCCLRHNFLDYLFISVGHFSVTTDTKRKDECLLCLVEKIRIYIQVVIQVCMNLVGTRNFVFPNDKRILRNYGLLKRSALKNIG